MLAAVLALVVWRAASCGCGGPDGRGGSGTADVAAAAPVPAPSVPSRAGDGVKVGTFLGDYARRFYGLGPAPKRLDVLWKVQLGKGWTSGKYEDDPPGQWSGSGWTGQPALVVDEGRPYLIAGGYDYTLRRIDAVTGDVVWEYQFDDIIKGSPSVYRNPEPQGEDDRYIVLAGSRRGYPLKLDDPRVAPYRALTFGSGRELWRLPVPQTDCYSRDCDGSGFYHDGVVYIGVESGWYYALDPARTTAWRQHARPSVLAQRLLLGDERAARHDGNLVLEASGAAVGDRIYVASGAGHVYGLRRSDLSVQWDYFTGSDMDGTAVPTSDGRLLVAVEKEYIPGHGGVLCLDPSRPPQESVEWFFPTGDRKVGEWRGGLIGSVAVNDAYNRDALAAFNAIDGYLHVVARDVMAKKTVHGPRKEPGLSTPVEVGRFWNAGSISTAILVGDALVAAGYDQRVHLYSVRYERVAQGDDGALPSANGDGTFWTVRITERAQFFAGGGFESTPVLWDGRIYIGCRDGWLYCLGDA